MESAHDQFVKDKLGKVSSCFFLAKWTLVTIHLHNGTTHSCHHPKPHQIPLEEIADSPSALHNTFFKISQRDKMIKGVRPEECNYCWRIEDSSKDNVSDRIYKSGDQWSLPYMDMIIRKDFYRFFKEHDRQRGTDFTKTFPEMTDFWNFCRDLADYNEA